jgi:CheY-like chemotaxis protein
VLREAGAEVSTAGSVDVATQLLPSLRPDVMVTDISLPLKDGFELLRVVRALPSPASRLPVIALTGYTSAQDAERITRAGFARYAAKPLAGDTLTRVIAEVVGASQADRLGSYQAEKS